MRSPQLFVSFLAFLAAPVFAGDELSVSELCARAQVQHESQDVVGADLSISLAKEWSQRDGVTMPAWCHKHYSEVRLGGLTDGLKRFDAGFGNDWNSAWVQIPWIEHTARELNVPLPPSFSAKAAVVSARNEEVRQRIISLCKPEDRCLLRD